jgi:cardiolipin synthase A/B
MWQRIGWLVLVLTVPVCLLLVMGGWGRETAVAAPTFSSSPPILINEIHADPAEGLAGDANRDDIRHQYQDEFVELVNTSGILLDISGWRLYDMLSSETLRHVFPAGTTLQPGQAVVIFGGGSPRGDFGGSIVQTASTGSLLLNNTADGVIVKDGADDVIVSYAYGSEANQDQSITRHPDVSGPAPLIRHTVAAGLPNSLYSPGTCVNGATFFDACTLPPLADLAVSKSGPHLASPEDPIVYAIRLQNLGEITATQTILTDSLPLSLTYAAHSGGYPLSQPDPQTLVWQMGDLPPAADVQFFLTTTLAASATGSINNTIQASTTYTESTLANNEATAVTHLQNRQILIEAVHYHGYEGGLDEAVALRNVSAQTINVGGWQLSDGQATAVIPANTLIPAHATLWLANDAAAFQRQFGHPPDLARTPGALPVPALIGPWPGFADNGDEVLLFHAAGHLLDALVYKAGNINQPGWNGPAVQPYSGSNFAQTGQILYRMRDQQTGLPVLDTDSAADWAQSTADIINGRKVRFPGWDLDEFFFTARVTETAVLTIAIAPDHAYETLVTEINRAEESIQIETLTIESVAIGAALAEAAGRGVAVTLLLEGGPAGGLTNQQKYICWQLELAGGECWFMINEPTAKIHDRYGYLHAKFMIVDGRLAIVSSQNLSPNSLPDDDKSDGTWGRRGVLLFSDAPGLVAHLQRVWAADFDQAHHDIFRWQAGHERYGLPAPGFTPITASGGITYPLRYPQPLSLSGVFPLEIIQSPENSLRDADGLLGLVNRAGVGDVVLVQQLYERPFWGPTASATPETDPNPRLEAYLSAARRGATVRLLLDAYFDDSRDRNSNHATCAYVNALARAERLRLDCALGNPTGLGIHNKMVLVQLGGRGYAHIGSLNGSEQAHKDNRELAIQVQSDAVYEFLALMFSRDWPFRIHMPTVFNDYIGPAPHILISEVLYDPAGPDLAEFIELVNPIPHAWDLSGYSIGDAVNRTDFEDVRRFPPGTILGSGKTLVIATSAVHFFALFNSYPDFEILDSTPLVPELIDDPTWGDPATFLQLGNAGDEVILRDPQDRLVDVLVYGAGSYPGVTACPLVTLLNASLERYPYWRHTGSCATDFREWPFPNPGRLP